MAHILLDLNNEEFQRDWFALGREEAVAVFSSLQKIAKLDWGDLYRDGGLRWEAITSRTGDRGQRLYSVRVSRRIRVVGYRHGNVLSFVSVHPDHDSAYKK